MFFDVLYGRLDVGAVDAGTRPLLGVDVEEVSFTQYAPCAGLKPRRYLSREMWSENFEAHPWLPLSL